MKKPENKNKDATLRDLFKSSYSEVGLKNLDSDSILRQSSIIKTQREHSSSLQHLSRDLLENYYIRLVTAFTIIIAITSWFFLSPGNNESQNSDLISKISKELIYNHKKRYSVDHATDDIRELSVKLEKLDFVLHLPQSISEKYVLVGGRHCSINGVPAAQLQLSPKSKHVKEYTSLYITPKDGFEALHEKDQLLQNHRLNYLIDKNVFFALISDE